MEGFPLHDMAILTFLLFFLNIAFVWSGDQTKTKRFILLRLEHDLQHMIGYGHLLLPPNHVFGVTL